MNKYQKEYVDFLKKFLDLRKEIKVVFDCSNGTTGNILKHLNTKELKAILINQNADGNFPAHGPDPLKSGAMDYLKKEVLKNKADLGIIFDADGDRVFFTDDKGRFIDPDVVASLLIWHLSPEKVVIDVRTGWLAKRIENKIVKSRVGHYFIKKLMREKHIGFGCEKSGHYYFSFSKLGDGVVYDSGIMAAVEIINAISKLPYKFSDYADLVPQYYRSGEINIRIMDQESGMINETIKKIENYFKIHDSKFKLLDSNHIDGLTMEFSDFWFNIRISNTESFIRLNLEAVNKQLIDKQKEILLSLLRNVI